MKKVLLFIYLALHLVAAFGQQYEKKYTTPEQAKEFREAGQMSNDSIVLGFERNFKLYKESGSLVYLYLCNSYVNALTVNNYPLNPNIFEEMRREAQQRGDTLTEEYAGTYIEEGLYYFYQRQKQKSVAMFPIAHGILSKIPLEETSDLLMTGYRMGYIYETMGEYEKAVTWASKCIKDAQAYQAPLYEARAYIILGRMTTNTVPYLAVDFAHKGLSITHSKAGNWGKTRDLLFDILANNYANYLNEYALAIQYSDSILSSVRNNPRNEQSLFLYSRMKAIAHHKLSQVDESEKSLQLMDSIINLNSMQSDPSYFSSVANDLGFAYYLTEHYDKARICYEKGIEEYIRKGYDKYQNSYLILNDMLMRIYLKQDAFSLFDSVYNQTRPYYTLGKPIDSLINTSDQLGLDNLFDYNYQGFNGLINNPKNCFIPDSALAFYEVAYKIINAKFTRGDFSSDQINNDIVSLKSFLDDFLNKRIVDRMTPEQLEKFWLISSSIKSFDLVNSKFKRQMGELNAPSYRRLKSKLSKTPRNDPKYMEYFDEYITYTRDSLLQKLILKENPIDPNLLVKNYLSTKELIGKSSDRLIIDLYKTDSLISAFIISGGKLHYRSIPLDKTIRNALSNLNSDVKTMNYLSNSSFILIEKEMSKLLSNYSDARRINFIADGELLMFPFELIMHNKQFLVEQFDISYSYSPFLLNESIKNTTHQVNRLLALAPLYSDNNTTVAQTLRDDIVELNDEEMNNGLYRNNILAPLPYTRDEVKGIESLFAKKKRTARILMGDKATKRTLNQNVKGFDVVHFATHGYSSTKNPSLSRLVFASDNQNVNSNDAEAFLYLDETYDLNLNADLVVLSACKTGTGKILEGEGVMSLPRGFIYAGVPNVIASLWKVHDAKTKDLMVSFYKHLLEDNVSYAEALRCAKIDCIKKGFLPLDWAGFVLIGN